MKKNELWRRFSPSLKKILLMSKIIFGLLLVGLMQVSAAGFSQNTLDLRLHNVTITEVLSQIENESEYRFFYDNEQIDLSNKVSVDVSDKSINEVLDQLFKDSRISYEITGRRILLIAKRVKMLDNQSEKIKITGKVTDSSGESLPGVTIIIKGTTNGTVTDMDGNYSIPNITRNSILQFSFIGMTSQEIIVGNKSLINVKMVEDAIGLEEVVAVGYGTMKKSDLTGSVASVKSDELEQKSTVSIESALQGRVAGVQIKTTSASPGGSSSIVIRGGNSINSSIEPLYVVDGFPMDADEASLISPLDIKSIEILKDGASTSIYGSRGANGVVLITTKKGKIGQDPKITYAAYARFEKPYNTYDFVNAEEYATLIDEAQVNKGSEPYFTGTDPRYPIPSELGEGTDWFDELTRDGFAHNHQLSVTGGSEKSKYRFSGNYYSHDGVMIDDDFTRGSLSAAIDSKIKSWLTTGINLTGYKSERNIQSNVSYIYNMAPFIPVYDEDGNYNYNYFPDNVMGDESPLNYVNDRTNLSVSEKVNGSFYMEIEPVKGLKFKSTWGGYINNYENDQYLPTTTVTGAKTGGSAEISNASTNTFLNENILTYGKKLGDDHKFNLMAAYSRQYSTYQNTSLSGTGFTSDKYTYNNIDAAQVPGIPASNKTKWQLVSYLGRLNYNFKEKYLFSFTGRADGSSKFGSDNRWAFFPSGAFAWRASEEDFLKNIDALSSLKVRLSFGETGNSNIGLYQSQGILGSVGYIYGNSRQVGVSATRVANPDLKWETTKQYDAGFDLGLFDGKVYITSDVYLKKTTDLLLDVNINATSGYSSALKNVGALQNLGAEFSADVRIIDNKNFKWNATGNISFNRNKITKLDEGGDIVLSGGGDKDVEIILREGEPIGQFRGAAIAGIFNDEAEIKSYVNKDGEMYQPSAKPGDIKFKDTDNDGTLTGDDWEILGDSNPDFIYSLNSSMTYKNFSLDLFFNGVYGNDIFNVVKYHSIETDNPRYTMSKEVLDRWTPENIDGSYPRMGSSDRLYAVEDGSYIKLSNVKLNYKIPGRLFNLLENVNIYLSAQNVFTITDYSGFDPDINTVGDSSVNFGTDSNGYPNPRTYTVGFNITF